MVKVPTPTFRHANALLLLLCTASTHPVLEPCHAGSSLLLSLPEALQQTILLQLSNCTLRFRSMIWTQMHTLSLAQKLQASQIEVNQVAMPQTASV